MSVDVEDYFQVSAFEPYVDKNDWDKIPCRVEENVDQILELFERKNIRGTFFTLGWMAQRFPGMVGRIVDQGHELASHGWEHVRVNQQTPDEFREDVERTKKTLEDISGHRVDGYRAASYSISTNNIWALDVLADTGHKYSSSVVPIKHDLYGMPEAPRFAFGAAGDRLVEIPISTINLAGKQLNCGGGGWFRFFPYQFSRWAIRQINERDQQPAIFYFHPWEIDPQQPRVGGIDLKSRFRHYINLKHMYRRLEKLLDDFEWARMDEVFDFEKGAVNAIHDS